MTRSLFGIFLAIAILLVSGAFVRPDAVKAQGSITMFLPLVARTALPALPLSAYRGLITVSGVNGNDSDLYTIRADGSEIFPLTDNIDQEYVLERAPNGEWIAFVRQIGTGEERHFQLWVIRPNGTDSRLLTDFESFPIVSWSPDSEHLSVYENPGDTQTLYITTPDLTTPITVTTDTVQSVVEWSPDGSALAYTTNVPTDTEDILWVATVDGTTTRLAQEVWRWHWSPDGSRLVYLLATAYGEYDVGWIRPDGTDFANLTQSDANENDFQWVDGNTRLLISRHDESGDTYEMILLSPDDGTETLFYEPATFPGILSVSPDGQQILWYESAPENENLWWQRVDSTEPVLLGGFRNTTQITPVRWSDDQAYVTWGEHYESFPGSGYYLVPIVDFTTTPPTLRREDILNGPHAQTPLWLPDSHILSINYQAEPGAGFFPTLWQVDGDTYSTIPFGNQLLSFDINAWWVETP